ncbi:MAG TPA: PilW family protein [Burkholderiales bacterium]|nr:PilW family protein [Burkholderiales bacterium]
MTQRAQGFSLVELMISITLGLLVLAVLGTIFANTSRSRGELQKTSQQVDNGRYAVELLSEDLQLAGYFGELNVAGVALPAALPDLCSMAIDDWKAALPIHMQGYDAGAGAPSCMPASMKSGGDVVALRRVRTCIAGNAGCEALVGSQPYLQVGLCSATANAYTLGIAADTAFSHTLKDCATAAGRRRYETHIYFVATDNGSGAAIPTLKRLELNGSGYTEVALVEGIERMEVEYGIDTDGDGSPDVYTADPSNFTYAGCTLCSAPANWSNVVTAKLHLLSRTLEPSAGYTDVKTYSLGLNAAGEPVTAGPFNDGYRRNVYTAAVRIVNPSARRDAP